MQYESKNETENIIFSQSKTVSTNSRLESSTYYPPSEESSSEKSATLSKSSSTYYPTSEEPLTEKSATRSNPYSIYYPTSEESSTEKPTTMSKSLSSHPPLVEKLFVIPEMNDTLSTPISTNSPPRKASLLESLFPFVYSYD